MPSTVNRTSPLEIRIERYVARRGWVLGASAVFITAGLLYFFRWGPVVQHHGSLWIMPSDIWTTYASTVAAVHGHLNAVYGQGMFSFPGFLAVLAPLGVLSNSFSTTFVEFANHGHAFTGNNVYTVHGTNIILYDAVAQGGRYYAVHQSLFALLGPLILLVSCAVLFATDALAERLGVDRNRRAVLSGVEAVLLWGIVVVAGHPEDVLAVALAMWALNFAFQGRWTGAGWLFGVAVAVQPLVLALFPLLLVFGGRSRALGLVLRGALPAAVVVLGPLAADPRVTLHALVDQPTDPYLSGNFRTLWTPLAPRIDGHGASEEVGSGPLRLVALALSVVVGWWSLRWRQRPEMIVWAAGLALALRVYTESVMTAYYSWPALAVGVLAAGRASTRRFWLAVIVALATTVVGQWNLETYLWWGLQVAGITAVLAAAAHPQPVVAEAEPARRGSGGRSGSAPRSSGQGSKGSRPKTASRR